MHMTQLLAFSGPRAGQDAEYNRWIDDVHIPEMLDRLDVLTAARRFALSPLHAALSSSPASPYLTVYDLIGGPSTLAAGIEQLRTVSRTMTGSRSIDPRSVDQRLYRPMPGGATR
jgi:hypothetical protein